MLHDLSHPLLLLVCPKVIHLYRLYFVDLEYNFSGILLQSYLRALSKLSGYCYYQTQQSLSLDNSFALQFFLNLLITAISLQVSF